jgi:hypothetical protein
VENTLQKQIAEYQAIAQQARSAGSELAFKLESLGWTILERIVDADSPVINGDCPVAISPELMAHEDWKLAIFDEDEDCYNIDALLDMSALYDGREWSDYIVRFPVIS